MAELVEISTRAVSNYEAYGDPTGIGRKAPRHVILGWSVATQVDPVWLETGHALPHLDSNQKPADKRARVIDLAARRLAVAA